MRRNEALRILSEHREEIEGYGVSDLSLFGSVARNEAGPKSDVDILVQFVAPVGLFEFVALKSYLELILGKHVDLVTEDALKRPLRKRILQEAIPAA